MQDHAGGGGGVWGEGCRQQRQRWMPLACSAYSRPPPSPPPPPETTSGALSPVSLGEKGHWLRVPEMVRVGAGALWGLLSVSWVVGWALVPCTCPLPPPVHARIPDAPGANWTLAWRGGGRGGEDQGIVGPPSTPLPLARPRKNSAGGRGVEGGVISSLPQTRP